MLSIKRQHSLIKSALIISVFLCHFVSTAVLAESESISKQSKIYSVGIIPQFEARKLYAIWRPILDQLQKETGLKFKFNSASSITEFEKQLMAGKYDFAYMNPFQPILTQKTQGYIPLVRDHSKNLQGILVVRKDSTLTDISQLNGTTIAFPSPNALGASLMLRAELINQHNIKFIPSYVVTHDSVYLNVVYNKVAAGGGVEKTFNWQSNAIKDKLRILYRTKTVAPHPLAVHPRIEKSISQRVQQALLKISSSGKGKRLLAKIPIKKPGIATLDDYRALADMGLEKILTMDSL